MIRSSDKSGVGVLFYISHDHKVDYDKERDEFMEKLGLKVIRIHDMEVKVNLAGVLWHLERELGLV